MEAIERILGLSGAGEAQLLLIGGEAGTVWLVAYLELGHDVSGWRGHGIDNGRSAVVAFALVVPVLCADAALYALQPGLGGMQLFGVLGGGSGLVAFRCMDWCVVVQRLPRLRRARLALLGLEQFPGVGQCLLGRDRRTLATARGRGPALAGGGLPGSGARGCRLLR